ncbi:unnamed protein product, partial [Polarella glacialis]
DILFQQSDVAKFVDGALMDIRAHSPGCYCYPTILKTSNPYEAITNFGWIQGRHLPDHGYVKIPTNLNLGLSSSENHLCYTRSSRAPK